MLDSIGNIASSIADLGRALGDIAGALNDRETWIRVALVLLGIMLILVALWPHR